MTGAASTATAPKRLPPGRHGLSRELVRESQRQRLMAAAAESLAEHGYGAVTVTGIASAAGVSTATLYQRFDGLWGCLLAAYEAGAERLCEAIEAACAAADSRQERVTAAVASALALLASKPALAYLLSAEPPAQANELRAARRALLGRLAAMLGGARERPGEPGGGEREARLVGGATALISMRVRAGEANRLGGLAPSLSRILLSA
jgi:AcrR family transcriptional regulator